MTDSTHTTILRQMTGRLVSAGGDTPLTSSRAVRLAMTKAADETVALALTVLGLGEEVMQLDNLLQALNDDMMLVGLNREGALAGLMAVDVQLRAAVIEMQTVGKLIGTAAEPRKPTATDKMMFDPLISALLNALPQATVGTELDAWADGVITGQLIAGTRAAGLVLGDHDYRLIRMSIDLGVAERQGELVLALPVLSAPQEQVVDLVEDLGWNAQFQATVTQAPARLDALLHRFTMPLAAAESLAVGQVVPLPGCTVGSVRMISPDGKKVALAKLGQLGGMRAIRIETPGPAQLTDLSPAPSLDVPDLMTLTD